MDKAFRDGAIDNLPWASIFDPAANARALSAIQAEGFRAARRIVDKFAQATTASADGAGVAAGAGADSAGLPDWEQLTRAWWSTAGQFLLRSLPAEVQLPAHRGDGPVTLDVNNLDSKEALVFSAARPGSVTGEVWLHNRESVDCAEVRLRCSDLLGHGGDVIGAEAVLVDPAVVPMPRRSSRGVEVTVDVGTDVRPGAYRGTLLAAGYPDLWLPVVLTVLAQDR